MALKSNKTKRNYSRAPAKKPSIDPDDYPIISPVHSGIVPDAYPIPKSRKDKIKK